jgi:ubiquinone/menaquinone biosynthesis C-methylase UbiE
MFVSCECVPRFLMIGFPCAASSSAAHTQRRERQPSRLTSKLQSGWEHVARVRLGDNWMECKSDTQIGINWQNSPLPGVKAWDNLGAWGVCMQSASPDFAQLKSNMKESWMAGDFGQIANFTVEAAEEFIARTPIPPGTRVLDVACGTGNTAIPAARAGGLVTGVDIAPNLLEQARKRAATEQLEIRFQEGDAEQLPVGDEEFEVVLTMFGAMFAPRPERVAAELIRVCRPGGLIAMANWTPEGFVGKSFQINAEMVPPPAGIPAPTLWGKEPVVRQRFANGTSKLRLTRHKAVFDYPFSPKEVVGFFRQYFGPTQATFSRLDQKSQTELASRLESLWTEHNTASDGHTRIEAEYLDVRAIRA